MSIIVPLSTAVTVTASLDGTIFVGSSLTLTCTIELLSEAVDIAAIVNTVWSGPSGTQFTNTTSVATIVTETTYISAAALSLVSASDSGEYTCTATVSPVTSPLVIVNEVSGIIIIVVGESNSYTSQQYEHGNT